MKQGVLLIKSSMEVRRLERSSVEKRLIKTKLEDLGVDSDKDLDKDWSSVEKLLIKMEPEDLEADNNKDLHEDKNTEEAKKSNWKLNRYEVFVGW